MNEQPRRLSESTSSENNGDGDGDDNKSIVSVTEHCVVNGCENSYEGDEKDPLSCDKDNSGQYVVVLLDSDRLTPKTEDEENGAVGVDGINTADGFGGESENVENAMVVVNDQDPMDLLMPLNPSNAVHDGDTEDSEGGTTERMTKEQKWEKWTSKYRWLLHEYANGDFGYCLYCDVTLHIISFKPIKQHLLSLYHEEREKNYIAFKESGEGIGESPSIAEIKQEYGIDSMVSAMKYQRISQTESLNNCNWIRWMHDHSWLVRKKEDGTIGFCKYCKTSLNVEFLHLRKRHEASKSHRAAERSYMRSEGLDCSNDYNGVGNDSLTSDMDESLGNDNQNFMATESKEGKKPFYELLPNSQIALCNLCNIKVGKANYRRHLRTKMHLSNLLEYHEKNDVPNYEYHNLTNSHFAKYAKKHPWLTTDPNNPSSGFCSVCQRPFKYGTSEKRLTMHENSAPHKTLLGLAVNNNSNQRDNEVDANNHRGGNQSDDSKSCNGDNDPSEFDDNDPNFSNESNESDNEEDHARNTIPKSTGKRTLRGTKEWFENKEYPWCKPNPKDRKSMICVYCQVTLVLTTKRWGHARSLRHMAAEKQIKSAKAANRSSKLQWLHYSRNKLPCCRICRVRFPNEHSRLRHEHTTRHRELLKEYITNKALRKSHIKQQIPEDTSSETSSKVKPKNSTTKTEPGSETGSSFTAGPEKSYRKRIQSIILQYKTRYPWLSYKRSETRPNYAWCDICEVAFFLPSIKLATKHQRASRHLRALRDKRLAAEGKSTIKTKETNALSEDTQERYPWLELEEDDKYCRCRVCDVRLPMKVLYRRQHDVSRKHLENMAKQANDNTSTATKGGGVVNSGSGGGYNAVTAADNNEDEEAENNESMHINANEPVCILEEEQDEVMSIKSEIHETNGDDSQDQDLDDIMAPPAKRMRTSNGYQENQVRTARKQMVNIMKNLKKKGRRCSSPFSLAEGILTSSFSIAACLTPLMQQQQQALTDGTASTPNRLQSTDDNIPSTTTTPARRDTIDLFLESIGQTLKSLPMELVAEGKVKIMQIICDLELRSMSCQGRDDHHTIGRQNGLIEQGSGNCVTASKTVKPTVFDQSVNGRDVGTSSTPLNKSGPATPSTISLNEEVGADCTLNGDDDDIVFINQRNSMPRITNTTSISTNETIASSSEQASVPLTNSNGNAIPSHNKNKNPNYSVSDTTFKPINTSIQISSSNESGRVRCVPLNALTDGMKRQHQQEQLVQGKMNKPTQKTLRINLDKHQVSFKRSHSNDTGNTSTNAKTHDNSSNTNSLRQIRVNTSTQSKYITIKPVTGGLSTVPSMRTNNTAGTTAVPTSVQVNKNNTSIQIRTVPK